MKRVLTAVILLPAAVYLILLGPRWLVYAAITLTALVCFDEYRRLVGSYELRTLGPFGYAAGVVLLWAPAWEASVLTAMALLALALALRAEDPRRVLPQASVVLLGVLYVFGPWRCALGLWEASRHWLLYACVVTWVGDTAAFYGGRVLGRHQLAPTTSPKKTWEGSAASVVCSALFGALYLPKFVGDVAAVEAVLLSAAANVAGQVGDLVESAMKRGAGVKDSGSLLPGHGGALDRLDSSLFALPAVYLWLWKPWQG